MDLTTDTMSLILAAWGAGLSSLLAYRGWRKERSRIGIDILHNFRVGDRADAWEWLAFEVTLRNASEKAISIVEYGITIIDAEGQAITGHPAHYGEMPNGDTVLEDPETQKRRAIDAHLVFLDTPVNLPPRGSASGWIAFVLARPVSRQDAEINPVQLWLVDHERRHWVSAYDGMGTSRPYRSGRSLLIHPREARDGHASTLRVNTRQLESE